MEFLNLISYSGYLPLDNVIYNVNSNIIVITKKEAIRRHASSRITAIIIGELCEGEKSCLDGLIFSGIGVEVVLDYSIKGLALAISLRVIGSRHTPLDDLYLVNFTLEVRGYSGISISHNTSRGLKTALYVLEK